MTLEEEKALLTRFAKAAGAGAGDLLHRTQSHNGQIHHLIPKVTATDRPEPILASRWM